MTREDANYYLKSSGFSDEQIDTIAKAYTEPCEDCISRKDAKKIIFDEFEGWPTDEEVAQLKRLTKQFDELPSVTPKPKWIPVSERLPESEEKRYWVCTDGVYQHECRWTNVNHILTNLTTEWHWHIMDIPQYSKVVAWMPLPEPYKTPILEEG